MHVGLASVVGAPLLKLAILGAILFPLPPSSNFLHVRDNVDFVDDLLTNHRFKHILQCHDPSQITVFIRDPKQVGLPFQKRFQQHVPRQIFRNKEQAALPVIRVSCRTRLWQLLRGYRC